MRGQADRSPSLRTQPERRIFLVPMLRQRKIGLIQKRPTNDVDHPFVILHLSIVSLDDRVCAPNPALKTDKYRLQRRVTCNLSLEVRKILIRCGLQLVLSQLRSIISQHTVDRSSKNIPAAASYSLAPALLKQDASAPHHLIHLASQHH